MQKLNLKAVLLGVLILFVVVILIFAIRGCRRGTRFGAAPVTWYVRPDGGTRYSAYKQDGQCNGQADTAYPGSGVNQPCAFRDIRNLWADGSYVTVFNQLPGYAWIGQGGDIYIIDCPVDCRIGYSGPNSKDYYGAIAGDPYRSGAPPPPSGTADRHTRILGKNFANCQDDQAKAHINGGYGVARTWDLRGVSYVDFACFNITDHSNCGKSGQTSRCATSYPLGDYADSGIITDRTTTNVTISDVRVHGMTNAGMIGPTGDGVVVTRMALYGNAGSGWNMDLGNGTTGTGNLKLDHLDIEWSGCAEEYPITSQLPYADCTDQNSSGYGDGLGTATVRSDPPWNVTIDRSTAAYNTQDGFDLLHLSGAGSTLLITDSMMYSNMGQQLKVGSESISYNNLIVGNCNALRQAIPGTPAGYNSRLSNFCRAGDSTVAIAVSSATDTTFEYNTLYCANATCVEISTNDPASKLVYRNNVFVGFKNSAETGYPASPPPTNDYSNPIYIPGGMSGLFTNPGSEYSHNSTWHWKSNWSCPKASWGEANAVCIDPKLTDPTWHLYGYGDMAPLAASPLKGAGIAAAGVEKDFNGAARPNPPTIGAIEAGGIVPPQAQTLTLSCPTTITVGQPFSCTVSNPSGRRSR